MANRKFQITFVVEADDVALPKDTDQALSMVTDLVEQAWDNSRRLGGRSKTIRDSYGFQGEEI